MQTMKFTGLLYTCTYNKERHKSKHYKIPGFPRGGNRGTFRSAKSKLQREISVVSRSRPMTGDSRRNDTLNPSGDNEINFRGIRKRATIRSLEMLFVGSFETRMATSPAAASGDQGATLKAMDGKCPAVKIEIAVINRRWLITPDYLEFGTCAAIRSRS